MAENELENLSTDDATLMLHIAGELDDGERLALEGRLASDAALRGRLEAMAFLDSRMHDVVASKPVAAVDSRRALNASIRLVREQTLLLQARPAVRKGGRLAGIPRWAWGTAVAACLAVGFVVWITNSDPSTPQASKPEVSWENRDGRPDSQARELFQATSAFSPVEAARGDDAAATSDIDSQVDALHTLAMMNDPN